MSRSEDFLRTAFASGYALAGEDATPVGERFAAAVQAAVQVGMENLQREDIIEATIQMGKTEGVWTAIVNRREKLYKAAREAVQPLAVRLMGHVSATALTEALQHLSAFKGEPPLDDDAKETVREWIAHELQALVEHDTQLNEDWRQLAHDMHLRAYAEGYAQAKVLVKQMPKEAATVSGMADFRINFAQAKAALQDLPQFWSQADSWVSQQVQGQAANLGNTIAAGYNAGNSWGEIRSAVTDVLTETDTAGAEWYMDQAVGTALSAGSIALYGSEGLQSCDFVTLGDGRVCQDCETQEARDPWSLDTVPVPPIHGGCRCVVAPVGTV